MADVKAASAAKAPVKSKKTEKPVEKADKPSTEKAEKTSTTRPEKVDEDTYKKELAAAEKELEAAKARLTAAKSKLDLVQSGKGENPHTQLVSQLRAELSEIRKKQQGFKDARQGNMEKIKKLDETLKARMNEQKAARSRVAFKSVAEIDQEIDRLQKAVDTGTMKIVDEKKALAEVTSLNRQKKGFAGFDQAQKGIDDIKAQISELKKGGENPEVKAMNERYNAITKQLDGMKAETDAAYKNINGLRDERSKAQAFQQEKFQNVRDIKDKYYEAKRAFRDWDQKQWEAKKERQNAERAAFESGKRKEIAQRKLEEASAPAYGDEILTAENLIRHFDPSSVAAKEVAGPGKFAAVAQRSVDDTGLKGTRVLKKDQEEESYFVGTGGKKGKKGKKAPNVTSPPAKESKFNLSVDVIEQLARIGVEPPMSQSHVSGVVTQIKEKVEGWKKDQDRKTKENIAKAEKEIERLEAESSPSAPANANTGAKDTHKKPADANQGLNGKVSAKAELAQEKDAVADAAAELKKAKIEDDAADKVEA